MDIIKRENIESGLEETGRVYLCGNLELPNGVNHIQTENYEIGISYYADFSADKPHYHAFNTEYNFVIEGEMKLLLLREGREVHLRKGDLFVLHTDEPYVGKAQPGTRVLFSKVPGGNDKVALPVTPEIEKWRQQWNTEQKGEAE